MKKVLPKGYSLVPYGTVPTAIPAGQVLMHNHIRHIQRTPSSARGFRAWTADEVPPGFVQCGCGWAGLPHFASPRFARKDPS